jgi:pimeloyl-ACP methyl ester carboxylesterase
MFLAMPTIDLPQAAIPYRDSGTGAPVVLLHGALVDGRLWRKVVPELEQAARVVVPDLPLGSHRTPVKPGADLTPPGLARLVADFLAALDLHDVTLVGNDTGGAIAQLVATRHPERIGRLVLTPCDAYENFLPPMFRPLQWAARVPAVLTAALQPLRIPAARRLPFAFGWLSKRPIDRAVTDEWIRPFLTDRRIRRDTAEFLRGIDKRYTLQAAQDLARFEKPALIAWAPEDRFFPLAHAERLAATLPDARLERIEDSYTFVSEDQPARTAELIRAFVA